MGNLIFAVLGLFLFATNPEPADFDQFIRSTIASKTESGNILATFWPDRSRAP